MFFNVLKTACTITLMGFVLTVWAIDVQSKNEADSVRCSIAKYEATSFSKSQRAHRRKIKQRGYSPSVVYLGQDAKADEDFVRLRSR